MTATKEMPKATEASKLSGMTAVTVKGLWANKSRFWLSGLAVVISVAFLTAMLILTSAIGGTGSDDVATANAGVDQVVRGEAIGEGAGPGASGDLRAELDADLADVFIGVDGVADAVAVDSATAQLVAADGGLLSTGAASSLGETWVDNAALAAFELVEGTAPTSGIVIDQFTADETGLTVGDTVQVITDQGSDDVVIEGIATYGTASSAPDTSTILFPEAAPLLGAEQVDRIVVETSLSSDELSAAVGLDASVDVVSGSTYIAELQDSIDSQASFRTTFLLAFAVIALVAGTTIIYNTFVIAVAQRTRELALLRSIGASRSQVLRAVMAEALVVGVLASIVGAGVGVLASFGLLALFEAIGLSILTGSLVIPMSSVALGGAVGLVVTLLSAFIPARKAADTPPIAALRDASVDPSGLSAARNLAAAAMLIVGIVLALVGAIQGSWEPAVGGVLLSFVGVIVGGPMLAGWFANVAGRPFGMIGGTVGRLASTNAARNPRRSASTALALTLGVALIAFFTVVASSLAGTTSADVDAAIEADQVVVPLTASSGPGLPAAMPATVVDQIPTGNGVEALVPVASTFVIVEDDLALAAGIDVGTIDSVYDASVSAGSLDDVGEGSVALHADAAEGLAVGDTIEVSFTQSGVQSLTVAAIFENNLPGEFPAQYLFDDESFDALSAGAGDGLILVGTDGSAEALASVTDAVAEAGGAVVLTADEYVDSLGSSIDTFRNFVYALLGAAVIIAIVGIANTTVMAIGERTKEIGMLRAVGMTAKQVRQMVRNEAMLLSAQGSLVGLALGVGGAYAVFSALSGGEITLVLPSTSLVLIGIAAAVSGVLAAAWPAWRASRLAPLEAIAS